MTMKTRQPKMYGISESSSKRGVYSNTILPQKHEKSQIKNPTLPLKQLEKEEEKKKYPKLAEEINHKDQIRNK